MHSEFYIVEETEAEKINAAKRAGHRVIAVGTTSCRTLESATGEDGVLKAGSGWTDIFIYPGYRFKMIDALITNFHLPQSTLLMLVSALAGREHILAAYEEAVRERYQLWGCHVHRVTGQGVSRNLAGTMLGNACVSLFNFKNCCFCGPRLPDFGVGGSFFAISPEGPR